LPLEDDLRSLQSICIFQKHVKCFKKNTIWRSKSICFGPTYYSYTVVCLVSQVMHFSCLSSFKDSNPMTFHLMQSILTIPPQIIIPNQNKQAFLLTMEVIKWFLYTPSVLKYKRSKFVLSQTMLTLTKVIEKKHNCYNIKLASLDTMKYIFIIYIFDIIDINSVPCKFCQTLYSLT
jgi:hypothetical protein